MTGWGPSLWLTLIAEGVLLAALLGSVLFPSRRIWPPTERGATWRQALVWSGFLLAFAGLLVVGVSSVGSLGLGGGWVRWAGAALVLAGLGLAFHGVGYLGERATVGLADALVTTGPYRYSRNPQYLGDMLVVIGLVGLTDSLPALLAGAVAILCFVVFPLAEEPWLERQYGAAYRAYRARVPRFLGRPGRG